MTPEFGGAQDGSGSRGELPRGTELSAMVPESHWLSGIGYVSGLLQLDAGVVIRWQGQVPESTNFWASH